MFKKKPEPELTPAQQIIASTEAIQDLENQKRPEHWVDYKGNYRRSPRNERKNKELDDAIEIEKLKIKLAEEEQAKPTKTPKSIYYDYSRTKNTTVTATAKIGDIGSHNKKGLNDSPILSGNQITDKASKGKKDTANTPSGSKKASKVKLIFFIVVAVLVLAGDAALSSYITSCVYRSKDNSSCTYSSFML